MKAIKLILSLFIIFSFSSIFAQKEVPISTYEQGIDLLDQHKYAEAITQFTYSIEENSPDLASAYYYRAFCFCQINRPQEGCADLHKASSLGHYVEKIAIPCGCDAKDPQ